MLLFYGYGCASSGSFPTEKEWKRTPVTKRDAQEFTLQGRFKSSHEFIQALKELKEGMLVEDVKSLGFTTDGNNKNNCDKLGWIESSNIVLANTHLMIDLSDLETITRGKKQYEGIKCCYKDIKSRTDRWLTYFNTKDTYKVGRDITLVLIFKNGILAAININDRWIKSHDMETAFGKVFGDILAPPQIQIMK